MRKWIGYYQNILSNDLCDKLIDYSDNQKPLQPSTYSTSSGKSNRSNERVKMDDGWFRNGEKYYNIMVLRRSNITVNQRSSIKTFIYFSKTLSRSNINSFIFYGQYNVI